jgi:serine carboxypeptidase
MATGDPAMRACLDGARSVARVLSRTALIFVFGFSVAAGVDAGTAPATHPRSIPPLVSGDEPIVVTEHRVQTVHGPLVYEARAGRLAIRSEETGEVRGNIFFVAYVAKPSERRRPITFAWNGGPTVASTLIHLEGLGPRRLTKEGIVDNAETLLADSDLVFYDAVETGFSRPAKPEFAPEFLNFQGDVAATVEFIRAYNARFQTIGQPRFIAGESYGVFRAAAVADELTQRREAVAGTILISGGIPNIPLSIPFYDSMHVPARTATAFHYHRLSQDLMRDRTATMNEVNRWVLTVYQPALEHLDRVSEEDRAKIARALARYIGMRPEQVDSKTLVVHAKHFLQDFFDEDKTRILSGDDTRELEDAGDPEFADLIDHYLRSELAYTTDLTYTGLEKGYMPTPGPPRRSSGQQFYYNQAGLTKEDWARSVREGEVTYLARDNPPWISNAMLRDKAMRVFVATGRYDLLNMCEGAAAATATLAQDLSSRISNHCYEAGHIVYRDAAERPHFLRDLSNFVQQTLELYPTPPAKQK